MKQFLLLLIMSIVLSPLAIAQNRAAMEKIEAAKIALITERLELTPEQAEKFWPIYREYANQRQELRREFSQLKREFDPSSATEEESKKLLQMGHQLKERQLAMDKSYTERMQQVVSTRQLMNLRKAEDDFRQMLMDRVREQKRERERLQNDRQRNQEQLKQRKMN